MKRSLLKMNIGGVIHRFCSKCEEYLPLDKFYVDKSDGKLRSWCRECMMADIVGRSRSTKFALDSVWGQVARA